MIEFKEFKGKTILVLTAPDKKFCRIAFGLSKAALILQHLEAIKEFVSQEIMKGTVKNE